MPIRFVPSQIRNRTGAALTALALFLFCVDQSSAQERTRTLTLSQGLDYAVHALKNGQPDLALQLTNGLLQASPKSPLVHYLQAAAYAKLDQPLQGRRAAARSYRYAQTSSDRYQSAQLAAKLAYEAGQPTLAQVWLRRTAIHAPDGEAKEFIAKDYKVLRRINPWSFHLRTDIRPSSNVNNGSDTAQNIIDGVPDGGQTPPSARALSGVLGILDLSTAYRLRQNETSATSLGGRLYVQRVALSSEAKAQAPNATGSDYGTTYAEFNLRHVFATGPKDKGGVASIDAAFGESWARKERSYRFVRVVGDRLWRLNPQTGFKLFGSLERRYKARFRANNAELFGLGGEISRSLENGDLLRVTVALRDTVAEHPNGTFSSASMRASYSFSKPVGPARLTLGLLLGYSDYDTYVFSAFLPPRGRTDKSIYGDVTFVFDEYDYAGFVPTLRLRAGKKDSNFSRFTSRELSLSLGIASKF